MFSSKTCIRFISETNKKNLTSSLYKIVKCMCDHKPSLPISLQIFLRNQHLYSVEQNDAEELVARAARNIEQLLRKRSAALKVRLIPLREEPAVSLLVWKLSRKRYLLTMVCDRETFPISSCCGLVSIFCSQSVCGENSKQDIAVDICAMAMFVTFNHNRSDDNGSSCNSFKETSKLTSFSLCVNLN